MKHIKDIFDLFRENQHKLDERPSRRAWQRLERRLDAQQRTRSKPLLSQLLMVAALLVLLLMVSVLVILPQNQQGLQTLESNSEVIPQADLNHTFSGTPSYEVVAFTKQLHDRLANPIPIAEGQPNKKLLPAVFVAEKLEAPYTDKERFNVKPLESNDKYPDNLATKQKRPVQALFDWLIGDWQSEMEGELSLELWSARDSQNLEGKGYLIKNGDTTFAENMSLSNIGDHIYLSTRLDSGKNLVRYKLTGLNGGEAIFENKAVDFPQQIILQQNSKDNFSTIYLNAQPVDMPESQIAYMLNRNAVINQQAIRNMNKVNTKK